MFSYFLLINTDTSIIFYCFQSCAFCELICQIWVFSNVILLVTVPARTKLSSNIACARPKRGISRLIVWGERDNRIDNNCSLENFGVKTTEKTTSPEVLVRMLRFSWKKRPSATSRSCCFDEDAASRNPQTKWWSMRILFGRWPATYSTITQKLYSQEKTPYAVWF